MQALRKLRPLPGIEFQEVPEPAKPGRGEVILAVQATGICGTDLHVCDWTPGYEFVAPAMPVTLGHELAGTVLECGEDVALPRGTLVAVRPSVVCGECEACRADEPDNCTHRRGIGMTRNGGFAPRVLAPVTNCIPVPEGLDAEIAALTEPMTVSAEAVDTAGVAPGQRVLVIGPGTIGQGAALFAEAAGAKEVVIAGRDDAARLATLRALGFENVVDTSGLSLRAALAPWLAAGPFDVVIEATGAPGIVEPARAVLGKRGILVICGIHPAPVSLDLTNLVRQHQQIRGSYRAPLETWPRVLRFLADQQERVRHMITHRLPLAEAMAGFELAHDKHASKVIVLPQA